MCLKTYLIARHDAAPEPRRAHVLRFEMTGFRAIDIALHRSGRGYLADHPRSGRALPILDQTAPLGPPVKLDEAKASLEAMMADPVLFARIKDAASSLPVLNPSFQ